MKRFILLTFGFMGWAFYEMSGGADFEPVSVRMARLNPVVESQAVVVAEAEAETVAPTVVAETSKPFVDTDPPLDNNVTRVSLNLTSLQEVLSETDPTDPTAESTAQEGTDVPVNVILSSGDTPAIIPSLISPNDGIVTSLSATGDVRTVSATRVNVRGGPGTDYGVVTKLTRGDAVEILQDNGDGWVKMRTLDGGPEGWMADFLLVGG
ncbi:MAG: SH3 domain-containing protein [Sulfitobacter sp.]